MLDSVTQAHGSNARLTDERGLVEHLDCYTPGNTTLAGVAIVPVSCHQSTDTMGGVSYSPACHTNARNNKARRKEIRGEAIVSTERQRRKRDHQRTQDTVNIIGIVASEVSPHQN